MEYRYTMPYEFMQDGSVPVKWRLYGIINGFWIAGKPVYATNLWLSTELQCGERQVSRALEQLEHMGLLTRNIKGYSRLILPGGVSPDDRGGCHQKSGEGDVGSQHISDSISDNIISVAVAPHLEVVEVHEKEERTKSKPKYPHAREVFSWFPKPQKSWEINTTELQHAELLFKRGEKQVRSALGVVADNSDNPYCPMITKPSHLEQKWSNLFRFAHKQGLI